MVYMKRVAFMAMGAMLLACAASGASFATGCEKLLTDSPSSRETAECLYRSAISSERSSAGVQLERLAFRNPDWPWFTFYLGNLKWQDAEAAQELYRLAAQQFAGLADPEGEVLALGNRSQLLFHLGRLEDAGVEAEAAFQRGSASGLAAAEAHGSVVLAGYLFQTGRDLQRARNLLVTAREQPELRASPHLLKTCLSTLGNVAVALGDQREAQRTFRELVDLAQELRDLRLNALAHYGLTRLAVERLTEEPSDQRRRDALLSASRTLEAARSAKVASVEAKAHWVLGMLLPWEQAQGHLELCEQAASDLRERSYCLNARVRRLLGVDPAAAEAILLEARDLAEPVGDPWSAAFVHEEEMRVSWAVGPVGRAVTRSWTALESIEAIRDRQPDGSAGQAGLFSTWADDYHWFAGRLLDEAQPGGREDLLVEAFAVSERLRARALTDWLRATGKGDAVQATARTVAGSGAPFATLAQVQRALGPREALLAFQVAPWEDPVGGFGGGSWVIAVTRRTVRAYPLPGRRELRQAVDLYTGLFEQRDGSEAAPSAHLFGQLLAPALGELPAEIDRLILVPDDALHRLPFGTLRRTAEAEPLAVTHRISVAPSASLWLGWRRRAPEGVFARNSRRSGAALVLAAPAVASDAVSAEAGTGPPLSAGLPPLVHARREGRAVATALGRGTELARGAAASESLLAGADLSRYAVLHLAAHAVTDEAHPERSAVVLAPGPSGKAEEAAGDTSVERRPEPGRTSQDGLLQAGEIAALDLRGKLVVLSSCRSASGTVLRGEGVMSLGRAFFQAGARTVVASLWPVRDDEAAALFADFYRHLARGETVAAALQAAQADRIAAGAPASAWAAFVALGDGDLAPVAPASHPSPGMRLALLAAGAVTALLIALATVAFKRRLAAALSARRPRRQRLADLASASSSSSP
jgi:CHAT domain-containing protein